MCKSLEDITVVEFFSQAVERIDTMEKVIPKDYRAVYEATLELDDGHEYTVQLRRL